MSMEYSVRNRQQTFLVPLFVVAITGGLLAQDVVTKADDEDAPVVELSPFIVDGAQDTGYRATATLAGTRIRTDLKDIGASVQVATKEFMEDLSATDAGTLLSYMTGTETGGTQGNFSGASDVGDGRYIQNDARTDPQFNQRIRGLGKATLTRGYFITRIPFDTFNTDQVTVNRGPNSLLFGIGDPGGVINNGLKQARFNDDYLEVSLSATSLGTTRAQVDWNQELIDDRVALRIALLDEDEKFQQDPAWERTRRGYAQMSIDVFKNTRSNFLDPTRLKVNAEVGESYGSPAEVIPPSIAYTGWYEPVDPNISNYSGVSAPGNVISPANGGTWTFQETYNPFEINSEGGINTNVHPSIFRTGGIFYSDPNSSVPSLGVGDLQGFQGLIPWSSSKDTTASTGLSGTPGVAGLEAAAGGSAKLKSYTQYHTNSPYAEGYGLGFAVPTLQNTEVFDYRNKIYSGGVDTASRDYNAVNISLEQTFFNNAFGLELSHDEQSYDTMRDFLFSGGNGTSTTGPYDIYVDIAEYLPNGAENPNLGRAYTRVARPEVLYRQSSNETNRVTAFGELDFRERFSGWLGHLGRHSFTGMMSNYVANESSQTYWEGWATDDAGFYSAIAAPTGLGHFRNVAYVGVYTSDSLIGTSSMDDVRLNQIRITRPQPGDTYRIVYGDAGTSVAADRNVRETDLTLTRYLSEANIGQQEIKSTALSWQSHLFANHVVGLLGWRKDDTVAYGRANSAEVGYLPTLPNDTLDPNYTRLSTTPQLEEKGETVTWSVIGRVPQTPWVSLPQGVDLQFHYGESENFNPVGFRNDALAHPIGQPTGNTKEYGFLLGLQDNKYSVRVNWYETNLRNVSAGGGANVPSFAIGRMNSYVNAQVAGIPFSEALQLVADPSSHPIQTYEQFYAAIEASVVPEVWAAINPRFIDQELNDGIVDQVSTITILRQTATTNSKAEGFEVELTANPTKNWRFSVNIAQQQTIQSDTAVVNSFVAEYFEQHARELGLFDLVYDPSGEGVIRTMDERWIGDALVPIRTIRALDGTVSNEQREWRFMGLGRYSFRDGALKGLAVGGNLTLESKAATGYLYVPDPDTGVPLPDLSHPYFDDGVYSGSFFASYSRKIFKGIKWSISLNVRNAITSGDDIPVKTNPDGQVAVIRIANPTTWTLKNTFKF